MRTRKEIKRDMRKLENELQGVEAAQDAVSVEIISDIKKYLDTIDVDDIKPEAIKRVVGHLKGLLK